MMLSMHDESREFSPRDMSRGYSPRQDLDVGQGIQPSLCDKKGDKVSTLAKFDLNQGKQ